MDAIASTRFPFAERQQPGLLAGALLLTSEGGQRTVPGRATFLECTLPQS
jgi:hypothetical protein